MKHDVFVCREVVGLGHRNAASLIKKAVNMALNSEGIEVPCIVSVMITDGEGIRWINKEYRGQDVETDVLSFPFNELRPGEFAPELCERDMDNGKVLLGDMLINLPRCESQGEELGHGFERELTYLTVHSTLHLLGYDHTDEGEMKRQMRLREKAIMGDTD